MGRGARAQQAQPDALGPAPVGGWTPENVAERLAEFQRVQIRNVIYGQPPLQALRQCIDVDEAIRNEYDTAEHIVGRVAPTTEMRERYVAEYKRRHAINMEQWRKDLVDIAACMLTPEHLIAFTALVNTRLK